MSDIEHLPEPKATGTMARRLARHLQGVHKLALKHTQAVDAVAAALGFRNRHELANAQGRNPSTSGAPNGQTLTPLQRLMTLYYAGGAHQALADRAAVRNAGDQLLETIVALLDHQVDTDEEARARLFRAGDALRLCLSAINPHNATPEEAEHHAREALASCVHQRHAVTPAGYDVAPHVETFLVAAVADSPNGGELHARLNVAMREIEKLGARVRDRDEHANTFGRLGLTGGQRLCEPHHNIDRFLAVAIADAGAGKDPRYAICLPDDSVLWLDNLGRDPHFESCPADRFLERIRAGELLEIRLTEVPRHLHEAAETAINPLYARWFSSRERWSLAPRAALERIADQAAARRANAGDPADGTDGGSSGPATADINPQQRLLLQIYDGGAHAELRDAAAVRATRDGFLIWAFDLLADVRFDETAAMRLQRSANRLQVLRGRLRKTDDGEPGIVVGGLDGFQLATLREMPDYDGPRTPDALGAIEDAFARMILGEVSEARGNWDWFEVLSTLECVHYDIARLASDFRKRRTGARIDPYAKPTPDLPLVRGREDLARLLLRITDNEGATADRYTLQFCDGDALTLSSAPASPVGVSQWTEVDPSVLDESVEAGKEKDVKLDGLPARIVQHAIARANEAYAEIARDKMRRGLSRDAVLQQLDDLRSWTCGPEYIFDVL